MRRLPVLPWLPLSEDKVAEISHPDLKSLQMPFVVC